MSETFSYRENSKSIKSPDKNTNEVLQKELDFWYNKYEKGDIDRDKYQEIKNNINDIINDNEGKIDEINKEYEKYKNEILQETGIEINKESKIIKLKLEIYEGLGINKLTYRNGTFDRVSKGIIDTFFDSFEMIEKMLGMSKEELLNFLRDLISFETLYNIIKSIGESISDIFVGDGYERGKVIGELLIGIISGGAAYGGKKLIISGSKKILKNNFRKKTKEKILKEAAITKKEKIYISKYSPEEKANVNELITNNYPLVEISRIAPNQNLVNITFGGIKNINDLFGQNFCDDIINQLKINIKNRFNNSTLNGYTNRVLKDDYKNLSFLNNSGNIKNDIFSGINNKQEIINEVLKSLNKRIYALARDLVHKEAETKKFDFNSKKEFDKRVFQKIKEIKSQISQDLDFGVSAVPTGNVSSDIDKLSLIRKAETASKHNLGKKELEISNYSHEISIYKLQKSQDILNHITKEYIGKKIEYNGVKYDIIQNGELSDELLRYVRKNPEKITPKNIVNLVQEYYKNINSTLDFISPVRGKIGEKTFERAKNINEQIRNGNIDTKYLTSNFKGGLTKEYFFESTKNLSGKAVFIDIKDMGIDNIRDFTKRSKLILEIDKKIKSGELSKEIGENQIESLMLESGKTVTDKFIRLQREIEKIFPNGKITLGGDEIYLFIPDSKINIDYGIKQLESVINSNGQNGRILSKLTKKGKDKQEVFNFLDKFSKVNKILEIETEKILKENGISGNFKSNSLHFGEEIISQITRKNFNLNNFIEFFEQSIKTLDTKIIGNKEITLSNIYEGINLEIKILNGNIGLFLTK